MISLTLLQRGKQSARAPVGPVFKIGLLETPLRINNKQIHVS